MASLGDKRNDSSGAGRAIALLEDAARTAAASFPPGSDALPEATALRELSQRAVKLSRAWERPACLGLFGPSQAGKSFLVGALLSHELGTLEVVGRRGTHDFLKEINPAKGVESTGVVTRFSTRPATRTLLRGDFECTLLSLEAVLESMATGFLVECTPPADGAKLVDRALEVARMQTGPAAPPLFAEAWDSVWLDLGKKYQDRHPYLNELRRNAVLASGAWKEGVTTVAGWLVVYSLLWGGPGYAPDLDAVFRTLVSGLERLDYAPSVEVLLDHVRASRDGVSVIDAACLNALGTKTGVVAVFVPTLVSTASREPREVPIEPGALSALIAEIRLPLAPRPGSLLQHADILDFPGGRALKGINGFGQAELSTGRLEHAIEVYKRGKLTFLFEQYAIEREITVLCLCSPGPTKPEAVQLQTQVESWLRIRYGSAVPSRAAEVDRPSLFLALTKFDMSLGALRSDNAKDRWESRVQEACVDFWARSQSSWLHRWGGKDRPFQNLFWIRNPYADQMNTLAPGSADFAAVKQGYFEARAVERHIKDPAAKWAAVEGEDLGGRPRSGVALLAEAMRGKLAEDVKGHELEAEARSLRDELTAVLRSLVPSRDEAEARARVRKNAEALVEALRREMTRRCSGAVFGEFLVRVVVPGDALEDELRKAWTEVSAMSIRASDKVKKVLAHALKWWAREATERVARSDLNLPAALVGTFVREVCGSKKLLPLVGNAVFPYFTRGNVDLRLIATILEVRVSDAFLELFHATPPRTPDGPVRISFSEVLPELGAGGAAPSTGGAGAIDWGAVDFSENSETGEAKVEDVEIVFAGSAAWKAWSTHLPEFYLENAGTRAAMTDDDPRVKALVSLLGEVERLDGFAGA